MGQYLPAVNTIPVSRVLTIHEPGERMAPFLKGLSPSFARFIHRLDQSAWRKFEPRIIRQVQAVITFTDQDKKALEKYQTPTPILKIPFGTTIPEHPLNPLGIPPLTLLFVGNFVHPPNVGAALRLIQSIYPNIQERFPELRLIIVGDQPPSELKQLGSKNVTITGRVPDLTPFFNSCALFVAPILSGGGMRVKILDALAAGKAIVASPLAVEGLDLTNGAQIVLAESDQEFVNQIDRLLNHPAKRLALAEQARAWACKRLNWSTSIETHEALYRSLMTE